jgi:excisionase family DNA binding protein
MDDELLTTAEAARIAGVGPTSVKRWADLKLLESVRTAGGHRRYRRAELERFLREHSAAARGEERPQETWVRLLVQADSFEVQSALLSARSRLGAWHRVAEELGDALVELGESWRRGDASIFDEHVASEKLARALARIGEAIPTPPAAPVALLATAQADDHTLGLSLVELCLREAGWACVWTGRRTPIADILSEIKRRRVAMLAVSASAFSGDAAALAREARVLDRGCRDTGALLVLGGSGAWPELPNARRLRSLTQLHAVALKERP